VAATQKKTKDSGAYILHLKLAQCLKLKAGRRDKICLPPGIYLYIGSAKRGISARVARHRRLAETKSGRAHWHVDYLLLHPAAELTRVECYENQEECHLSNQVAHRRNITVPIPGFGATDCRSRCAAHFYCVMSAKYKTR
jgi:Uri superfamily endonuclease